MGQATDSRLRSLGDAMRSYRLGECDVCGDPDVAVTTLHSLGTLQVCNPCLIDVQGVQREQQMAADADMMEECHAGELIPHGWGSLDGLTGEQVADVVWDRR